MVSSLNHQHNHAVGAICEACRQEEMNMQQLQQQLKQMSAVVREHRVRQSETGEQLFAPKKAGANRFGKPRRNIFENKIAVMIVLCVFGATAVALSAMVIQTSDATSKLRDVVSGHYQTVGTDVELDITNGVTQIHGAGLVPISIPDRNYHGGWKDELDLLNGRFDNTTWVQIVPQGFITENGTVIYSASAPEMAVVTGMRNIRDEAARVFRQTHAYPQSAIELGPRCMMLNPVSGKQVPISVTQYVGAGLAANVGHTQFETDLKHGKTVGAAEQSMPFQIKCIDVRSEPKISSDMNSYGWQTDAFFIQGLDRDGRLIKGDAENVYTLVMKNGVEEKAPASLEKLFETDGKEVTSLTFFSDSKPSKEGTALRYAGIVAIGFFAVFLKFAKDFHRGVVETSNMTETEIESTTFAAATANGPKRTAYGDHEARNFSSNNMISRSAGNASAAQ